MLYVEEHFPDST